HWSAAIDSLRGLQHRKLVIRRLTNGDRTWNATVRPRDRLVSRSAARRTSELVSQQASIFSRWPVGRVPYDQRTGPPTDLCRSSITRCRGATRQMGPRGNRLRDSAELVDGRNRRLPLLAERWVLLCPAATCRCREQTSAGGAESRSTCPRAAASCGGRSGADQ